jgi:ribose 5-phosphate isomerase A
MSEENRDTLKRQAAEHAVAEVADGMVVGLGTGSTAAFALEALAERVKAGLRIVGIATSEATAQRAKALGIPLGGFAEHAAIDLVIDGADEVERASLALIKGHGGALLREKIVAAASRRLVIVVDETKLVERLGAKPVPVEIVRFGWEVTYRRLLELAASVTLRRKTDGGAFVTDGGNFIADCAFGPIADPAELAQRIKALIGVVESGLFIGLAKAAVVAGAGGVRVLTRADGDKSPFPSGRGSR